MKAAVVRARVGLCSVVLLASACANAPVERVSGQTGSGGVTSGGMTGKGGAGGSGNASGGGGGAAAGAGGQAGSPANGGGSVGSANGGGAGSGSGGNAGNAGSGGNTGTPGTGGSGGSAAPGTDAAADVAPAGDSGGSNPGVDQKPDRPLAVNAAMSCKCELQFSATSLDPNAGKSTTASHAGDTQSMRFDATKKPQGKLAIVLGGINGGPGPGGIYGYAVSRGFHAFLVATQTNVSSAPQKYKMAGAADASRQVADARMEAWDGTDRVDWLDIKRPDSVERRTELALQNAKTKDPGGDWGYYLNGDGSVRWSDVVMVGYSFGAQTIGMVSKYVRFSRVVATSGPQDEGFPMADWIKKASATPVDRLFMMVGGSADYPPASGDVGNKVETVLNAGWVGPPVNLHAGAAAPIKGNVMILVPQGHSEMCAGDGGQWKAVCDHAFGVVP